MTRNPLAIDAAVAVVIVLFILIIEPGVAIAAILALIVLAVCGITYLVGRRRGRTVTPAPRARRR